LKAAVLGTETLKNYLINYARSFIYTTFMGFSSLASIHCAYQMLEQGVTREVSVMLAMVGGDMRFFDFILFFWLHVIWDFAFQYYSLSFLRHNRMLWP
jgi:hypothetical protein